MSVGFRLLGDVEAEIDGRLLDLGHARQRCVMVSLLVGAGHGVSVDQLVDRVWGDRVPQRARAARHSYLSRLRRLFAASTVQVVRQPGGYALAVDPMVVDLHRFQRLVGQARVAGDEQRAWTLLEEALGLWRGPAFGALETPWVAGVREALEQQRWAAQLDHNDLGLRRGLHSALLPGLAEAAAAHPLDERVAGQLVLALYRSSRQATPSTTTSGCD